MDVNELPTIEGTINMVEKVYNKRLLGIRSWAEEKGSGE